VSTQGAELCVGEIGVGAFSISAVSQSHELRFGINSGDCPYGSNAMAELIPPVIIGKSSCSMSSLEHRFSERSVGLGNPYHNIVKLVRDKERIERFAEASEISRRNVRKDECGQWTISGTGGHVQVFDDQSYLLYVVTYSARKWGAIKRKAKAFGWELTQDGDDEGCFHVGLPNEHQSEYLRALLGLRRRRATGGPLNTDCPSAFEGKIPTRV
jgi:hypothetical protein